MEFRELSAFNTAAVASQGIAFDGTHYYLTDSTHLRKYTAGGSLVASRDCTVDGVNDHLAAVTLHGGVLYIPSSAYPSTPYNDQMMKYDPSDLSFEGEIDLGLNEIVEGVCFLSDGTPVTVSDNNVFREWDSTSFTSSTVIPSDYEPHDFTGGHGFQNILRDGEDFYLNVHSATAPQAVTRMRLENGEFKVQEHYLRPESCTQGLCKNGENFIFARRIQGAVSPDQIVTTQLVPDEYRNKTIQHNYISGSIDVTSGSYTESTSTRTSIFVREDDIVEAVLQGHFYVTGSTRLRVKVDPSTNSSVNLDALHTVASFRTGSTNSDGETGTHIAYFRARGTGTAVLTLWWHLSSTGSGKQGFAFNRSLDLRIIGKASN